MQETAEKSKEKISDITQKPVLSKKSIFSEDSILGFFFNLKPQLTQDALSAWIRIGLPHFSQNSIFLKGIRSI